MKKLLLLPGALVLIALLVLFALPREQGKQAGAGIESVAQQRSASRSTLMDQIIPPDDLPPEGTRSLFDHLVRENGNLPYPFDRVLQMLAGYDEQARLPHNLMIPDGRSLLKGQAHFAAPRIVVAADARPAAGANHAPLLRGRLFLGFVEEAAEIEVISYNEVAGRFEFQLVENYCEGCVPRIVYAKRAICTTCHSGGGPIFPVRPWAETNVNPQVSSRLAEQIDGQSYFAAPVDRSLEDGQAFDDLTDIGNVIPTTQRIWLEGCGEQGHACRRQMLDLALQWAINPIALDQMPAKVQRLQKLQAAAWPASGISLANGDLNNRDPLRLNNSDASFWQKTKALFQTEQLAIRTGDKLTDFDALPALSAELDPLTPRPAKKHIDASQLDGVYGLAQMFSTQDIAWLEQLAGYDADKLSAAVAGLSDLYFDPVPFQRVAFLDALGAALGAESRGYCCVSVDEMSEPVAQGEPPLQLATDSNLKNFEQYCFACHRGNPSQRLNFMSGSSEAEVLAKIQGTDNIREVLDYERYLGTRKQGSLMPPADSWQREALEASLAKGGTPLQQMRDQIPSLFEF